jgi:hypothetical protein
MRMKAVLTPGSTFAPDRELTRKTHRRIAYKSLKLFLFAHLAP